MGRSAQPRRPLRVWRVEVGVTGRRGPSEPRAEDPVYAAIVAKVVIALLVNAIRGKPELTPTGGKNEVTCYAESSDGVHWKRPELGLFEVHGSRNNNVILDSSFSPIPTDFSPFLDTRPGVAASEKYKALGGRFDGRVGKLEALPEQPPSGVERIS